MDFLFCIVLFCNFESKFYKMNRKNFLKALGFLAATPIVAKVIIPEETKRLYAVNVASLPNNVKPAEFVNSGWLERYTGLIKPEVHKGLYAKYGESISIRKFTERVINVLNHG